MNADHAGCKARLIEAHRALLALESLESEGFHRGVAIAVMNARTAYTRLSEHQDDPVLTVAQAALVQTALELLRAKLRALGYSA